MTKRPWAPNAAKEKAQPDFPCRYAIKAMGRADLDFQSVVLEIVRRHAPHLDDAAATARLSSGGKWLAVTISMEVQNRNQLNAIYRDLSAHELVVWAL
ncbi:DUF493 domain-containing protein [uncultured Thiodictyon sp.]|uniref:YbeD family protein n=1 Tax=uncultured Thiodictyon sp. TaxID=1846217 RepID=UPI0025F1E21D|nr:DUF493 domain-containing protein [uncultured Thiodictyon sp.]